MPRSQRIFRSLPKAVFEKIKPIYQDLSDQKLLSKCLHCKTQNSNESFNAMIWNRAPKTGFVDFNSLKLATLDALLAFNEGHSPKLQIFKSLGFNAGLFWLDKLVNFHCYFIISFIFIIIFLYYFCFVIILHQIFTVGGLVDFFCKKSTRIQFCCRKMVYLI